jgi:hypothetical protein
MKTEIKVSKDEFYKKIGPLDVTVSPEGNYPYKTMFKLRGGEIVGYTKGHKFEDDDYFLACVSHDRKGGTENTLKYAEKENKKIILI